MVSHLNHWTDFDEFQYRDRWDIGEGNSHRKKECFKNEVIGLQGWPMKLPH